MSDLSCLAYMKDIAVMPERPIFPEREHLGFEAYKAFKANGERVAIIVTCGGTSKSLKEITPDESFIVLEGRIKYSPENPEYKPENGKFEVIRENLGVRYEQIQNMLEIDDLTVIHGGEVPKEADFSDKEENRAYKKLLDDKVTHVLINLFPKEREKREKAGKYEAFSHEIMQKYGDMGGEKLLNAVMHEIITYTSEFLLSGKDIQTKTDYINKIELLRQFMDCYSDSNGFQNNDWQWFYTLLNDKALGPKKSMDIVAKFITFQNFEYLHREDLAEVVLNSLNDEIGQIRVERLNAKKQETRWQKFKNYLLFW